MYLDKGICAQTEVALHTHDRIAFKRCRRKWGFTSPFRRHLKPKASLGVNPHLWFGSGFHWAMEDYHGYRRFSDTKEAFQAYVLAHQPEERPDEYEELEQLGYQMLDYYEEWEVEHANWKTVWLNDVPLVEVRFSLILDELCYYELEGLDGWERCTRCEALEDNWRNTVTGELYTASELDVLGAKYVEIVYHGTFDRIVEDSDGNWWVLDYKTAKAIDTNKLSTDPQISAYCWAAEQWFQRDIAGMIYLQISKSPPKPPKKVKTGISTDKRQRTSAKLYRAALEEEFGAIVDAPSKNRDFLQHLIADESLLGDKFIRADYVPRNEASKIMTYQNIIAEGKDMINPDLYLYPNPTKDCSWDCPFKPICIAMEDGADWEYLLEEYEFREETMNDEIPKWQKRMFRTHPDLFPEEFHKYCKEGVDTLAEFVAKDNLESVEITYSFRSDIKEDEYVE